jgi:hypothetical protein
MEQPVNWVAPDNIICPFTIREDPNLVLMGEGNFLELILRTAIHAGCMF